MGVCVTHIREAIFSRFKGLSPLGWCVGIVGGIGFFRRSLGAVSVPPMVGRGVVVLLWGCVWACIVRPLICTGVGGGCTGHLWGRVCTTCVHIGVPVYVRARVGALVLVHKRPNLCTCSPVRIPPRSCGCVRVRARGRPYNILSPPETFLSNFYGSGVMARVVSTDVPN